MSKSKNAEFDFLVESQSHKHLTLNDALLRLDSLSQLVIMSISANLPNTANEGDCYVVKASDPVFSAQGGKIALFTNGGYVFIAPKIGWSAYVISASTKMIFNGVNWAPPPSSATISEGGFKILKFEQALVGDKTTTTIAIPEKTSVIGVTARVTQAITGVSVTSWSLGISGALDRYGSGLWLGLNGWSRGLTTAPQVYWSDRPLIISPNAGTFSSGKVMIWVHYLEIMLPAEV